MTPFDLDCADRPKQAASFDARAAFAALQKRAKRGSFRRPDAIVLRRRERGGSIQGMHAANRIKVESQADHVVIRFGISTDADPEEFGEAVTSVMVPLGAAGHLGFDLLEVILRAGPQVTQVFASLNTRSESLNARTKSTGLETP